MTATERDAGGLAAGAELAGGLLDDGAHCLVLGEIGIGNTATAALLSRRPARARTTWSAAARASTHRGCGERRDVDAAALARAAVDGRDSAEAMRELGGLELAALAGAIHAAHDAHAP